MTVRQIVNLFVAKKIPDNIIYTMHIDDSVVRYKVLAVYEPTNHAFVVDLSTKHAQTLADPTGEFFLSPKDCLDYRIRTTKERIEWEQKELEKLENLKKKL